MAVVATPEDAPQDESSSKPTINWWRIVALIALMVGLFFVARATGLDEYADRDKLQGLVEASGPWGVLVFLVAFAVGELMHIPGVVFVAVGILAFGKIDGSLVSLAGALLSVCVSFVVVRTVGGQPLASIERPIFRKILDRLVTQPIRTVALLRLIFWMAPPLNYALAMSGVKFRHYFVGSALGLVVPVTLAALFLDWLLAFIA